MVGAFDCFEQIHLLLKGSHLLKNRSDGLWYESETLTTIPFWIGENVTLSKVVRELQLRYQKVILNHLGDGDFKDEIRDDTQKTITKLMIHHRKLCWKDFKGSCVFTTMYTQKFFRDLGSGSPLLYGFSTWRYK